ncbi:hypothetical protein [Streptomyces lomondensis]|uniref:Vegetative cell wall protein gp1 n=1 Tax=Streptomyces lomondensis TaxID=68229 RepID=A0ABQ2XGW0_9ACTN|nr:hypothetical protein [Streptomyces lomondensis]MCF0080447.1 hypothetical protein [Streptomyces lomondensis]GGX16909.1 hypothetical protein GCM10010383_53810 [Streptomyces lomondensis]
MSAFLGTLGGKLAERWSALLVLPGLLYLGVLAGAVVLGRERWYDVDRLRDVLDELAAAPAGDSPGVIVLTAAGVLAGAFGVDQVARALGAGIEGLWLAEGRGPVARRLTARRLRLWRAADDAFREALVAAGRARVTGDTDTTALAEHAALLNAERNRIALAAPSRPFWVGNRLAAVEQRVWGQYRLDLASAWPRLWLLVEDGARLELHTARQTLAAAHRLQAWGVLYGVLAVVWWPAVVLGAGAVVVGVRRARVAAAVLAELVESAVDLRIRTLAADLGLDCPGPVDQATGEALTRALRKGT